ncbi:MAG: TetR/AcrR family transcriptional regulator [Pseudomonadota bacterium]
MSRLQLSEMTRSAFSPKTKGRILLATLELLNRRGFEGATTADLAAVANVLEGTLWYHFNSKKELLLAHLDTLEGELAKHLQATHISTAQDLIDRFVAAFDLLWDFRYLLRASVSANLSDGEGQTRLAQIYANVETRISEQLHRSEALGLINLKGVDVACLSTSCFLVGRYWIDYSSIRFGETVPPDRHRSLGMLQVVSVLEPHLTEAGRALRQGGHSA